MAKKALFDDGEVEPRLPAFTVNEKFAKRYEEKKRADELRALEEKYAQKYRQYTNSERRTTSSSDEVFDDSDDHSGSSESEMSDVLEEDEQASTWIAKDIDVKLVDTIKKLRNKDDEIYDSKKVFFDTATFEEKASIWLEMKEKGDKPINLKEYHNKLIKDGFIAEEANAAPSYNQQQEALQRESRAVFLEEGDVDDPDDFFLKKIPVAGLVADASAAQATPDLPDCDEDDKFLIDYLANRSWIPRKSKDPSTYPLETVDNELEEDEENLDAAEEFESTINFRYEPKGDPSLSISSDRASSLGSSTQIVGHARTLPSVRRTDDSRKKGRDAAKERRKREKEQELQDLKRLKNLKKLQLVEKMSEISSVAGKSCVDVDLSTILDDENDFDPDEFDKKMSMLFNESYYAEKELDPTAVSRLAEMSDEDMGTESAPPSSNSSSKKLVNEIQNVVNDYEKDYYGLHFEDRIRGFGATRFKYKSVVPSTFGLNVDDILAADDGELKRFVSLKKLAPYKSEEDQQNDIVKYSQKKRIRKFLHASRKSTPGSKVKNI